VRSRILFRIIVLSSIIVSCQGVAVDGVLDNSHDSVQDGTNENPSKAMNKNELKSVGSHPIMFYNVENLFDTEDDKRNSGDDEFLPDGPKYWDSERYKKKLSRIEEALFLANGESPLMCGFAEIENRKVLEDLIKTNRFAKVNYKVVHFDSEDQRGIDCGFIYDADRFFPELETRLAIRMKDEPHFRTRDILYIKGFLSNQKSIHVFVNHWSSRREGEYETEPRRLAAAHVLRAKVDEILEEDEYANIAIVGDFNDTPLNRSLYEVMQAKGQHEQKAGSLVNLLLEEQRKDLGTAVHRGKWDVIDNIIISQGLLRGISGFSVKDNNAFIVKNEKLLFTYKDGKQKPSATFGGDNYYGGFSDHLPVFLILQQK